MGMDKPEKAFPVSVRETPEKAVHGKPCIREKHMRISNPSFFILVEPSIDSVCMTKRCGGNRQIISTAHFKVNHNF